MITKIGIVAGEIWQLLEHDSSISVSEISSRLERPEFLVFMSLGWLLREGHILLEEEDGGFTVSLRKKKGQTAKR
jgi:hypothetical protein